MQLKGKIFVRSKVVCDSDKDISLAEFFTHYENSLTSQREVARYFSCSDALISKAISGKELSPKWRKIFESYVYQKSGKHLTLSNKKELDEITNLNKVCRDKDLKIKSLEEETFMQKKVNAILALSLAAQRAVRNKNNWHRGQLINSKFLKDIKEQL